MRNQRVTTENPTDFRDDDARLEEAANCLNQHRDEIGSAFVPALKDRFGLTNLQAIDAAKRAHEIDFGGQ